MLLYEKIAKSIIHFCAFKIKSSACLKSLSLYLVRYVDLMNRILSMVSRPIKLFSNHPITLNSDQMDSQCTELILVMHGLHETVMQIFQKINQPRGIVIHHVLQVWSHDGLAQCGKW